MKVLFVPTMELQDDLLNGQTLHKVEIYKSGPSIASYGLVDVEKMTDVEVREYYSIGQILEDYKLVDMFFTSDELHRIAMYIRQTGETDLIEKIDRMFDETIHIKKAVADNVEMLENSIKREKIYTLSLRKQLKKANDSLRRRDEDTYNRTKIRDNWEKNPWYIKPFVAFDIIKQFIELV